MKQKIRIAIYSRKSKYTLKGDSIGNQIELAMEYIRAHYPEDKYDVEIKIFEDEGFSGGNLDRPKFKRLIQEERIQPFDILICYRLDRISRNIADFSNLMNELSELNTSFISIKEQFDTSTPMGRAMMYIASVFAQLEREVIAERIRDNMIELAKTGRWLGGDAPLGYKKESYKIVNVYEESEDNVLEKKQKTACKLIEDEETSDITRLIFSKYLELKSLAKLEKYLYQNDIKTKNGVYFTANRLRAILSNPAYSTNSKEAVQYFLDKGITVHAEGELAKFDGNYGLIAYNKTRGKKSEPRPMEEWVVAVGLHKGIIRGIDWVRVQDLLEKNSEKRYRHNNTLNAILSGLIRCKDCGDYMRPKVTNKLDSESKRKRFYYTCVRKEKSRGKKCQATNVNGILADKMVLEKLKEVFVPSSEIYKELKNMTINKENFEEREDELQALQKEHKKNMDEINSLVDKLKYIDPSVIEYINAELKRLKDKNTEIEEKIAKLEKNDIIHQNEVIQEKKGAELILDIVNNCFETFDSFDIKFKKDVLRVLIENITGTKNELEVNLLNTKLEDTRKRIFTDIMDQEQMQLEEYEDPETEDFSDEESDDSKKV